MTLPRTPWTDADEREERQRVFDEMDRAGSIFVFGSNRRGIHGAGAAKEARALYGAHPGQGEGLQGRSYALPTMERPSDPFPLDRIETHVRLFLTFARLAPGMTFVVTRVGCGYAGYHDDEIAPMFDFTPANVRLPYRWVALLTSHRIAAP